MRCCGAWIVQRILYLRANHASYELTSAATEMLLETEVRLFLTRWVHCAFSDYATGRCYITHSGAVNGKAERFTANRAAYRSVAASRDVSNRLAAAAASLRSGVEIVRWIAIFQHPFEGRIGIRLAAVGAQGLVVVHPATTMTFASLLNR